MAHNYGGEGHQTGLDEASDKSLGQKRDHKVLWLSLTEVMDDLQQIWSIV